MSLFCENKSPYSTFQIWHGVTRYTEASSLSSGISGRTYCNFFFLKLQFSHYILAPCFLQKPVCLLTTVFIWHYLTWPNNGPERMQGNFSCFGGAPCSCSVQSRPTSLTSAHSWLMITKSVPNGWKDSLRCYVGDILNHGNLDCFASTFINVVRTNQIFYFVICYLLLTSSGVLVLCKYTVKRYSLP